VGVGVGFTLPEGSFCDLGVGFGIGLGVGFGVGLGVGLGVAFGVGVGEASCNGALVGLGEALGVGLGGGLFGGESGGEPVSGGGVDRGPRGVGLTVGPGGRVLVGGGACRTTCLMSGSLGSGLKSTISGWVRISSSRSMFTGIGNVVAPGGTSRV
jgi:hypothetical protein